MEEYWSRFAAQQAERSKVEFRNSPPIGPNRTVAELVFTYLYVMGQDLKSVDLWDKFDEIMTRLVSGASDNPAGVWIFKATTSLSSALAENGGRNSLGLATISSDGDNLTIVSSSGQVELNFNGTLIKGRLSGQLGLASVSAKCEGAVTSEKISISFNR